MNVLILCSKLPYPPRDGGSIATLNLATGLAEAGIDITTLSFNTRKHYFPPDRIPDEIKEKIRFYLVDLDTSIKPLKALINLVFSRKPYIAERFRSRVFSSRLKEILNAGDFGLVQLEGPYLSGYIPVIRRFSSAKIALRSHNVEHEIWERIARGEHRLFHRLYYNILARRIKTLEKRLIQNTDLLVPVSQRDEKILLSLANRPPSAITIPVGLSISSYPYRKPSKNKDICFIGALDWSPNKEGLLWFIHTVLPSLIRKYPAISLHIAGRNGSDSFISKLSHPSIQFHGEVENTVEFLSSYSVMVVPILSGSGIRVKILEGMALGIPVVTTTLGAEGIPVTDGAQLLIADESEQFAETLLQLLENRSLAEHLSSNARKMAEEKFDTFTVAAELANLYKRMV
jgi:glycosyltransferase involved in cell wall biosynthesis